MYIYSSKKIKDKYDYNLIQAQNKLKELEIFCGEEPKFLGLNGWVFEKTIQSCIREEFRNQNIIANFTEQFPIESRKKVDLKINNVCLDIKVSGLYDKKEIKKHEERRNIIKSQNMEYIFLTGQETHEPYEKGIISIFGNEYSFFLFNRQRENEWQRFIDKLVSIGT